MVKMANEKCGTSRRIGADVHCLWCIDHRLNLVAQDFNRVPNINFVIKFIDWITGADRLVSYTAFARRNSQMPKKKKIPTPSDTRWLFYREALKAILEQTETLDQFLNLSDNREKWVRYIASPSHPLGQVKDVPLSFNHPLVNAHFRLAFDIHDILADINTVFQMKFSEAPLWVSTI